MTLEEFFKRYARNRGVTMADAALKQMKENIGVQAATRRTRSGRLVAIWPAIPGAYPRKVSGRLWRSARVVRTAKGAKVRVGNSRTPYAGRLEFGPGDHAYFYRTLREMGLL